MELQLINQLSESRLFRSLDQYQKYTLQDIAELTYIYILILELFRTTKHEDFAQKYVKNTIRFNNFHSFKFSANDLYHFSHLLVGDDNERSLDNLKNTSHKTNLDFLHYRKFLRDIVNGTVDEAFDKRYLLRIESELKIKSSNLRSIRRMVTSWIVQQDMSMAKSAATKLLIELRKRAIKSELRMELEKFGRLDEYKMIKVDISGGPGGPDVGKINVFKNPSHQEMKILLQKHGAIRAILDVDENIYVWNAYDAIHYQIERQLEDEVTITKINLSLHEELPDQWDGLGTDLKNAGPMGVKWTEINGIWIEGYNPNTSEHVLPDSKWLKRALGVNSLNEARPPRNFRRETLQQRFYRAWNTIMEMNNRSDDYFFGWVADDSVMQRYLSRTWDEDLPNWIAFDDIPDVASKEEVIQMLHEMEEFFWEAFESYNWGEEDDPFEGDYPWDGLNESLHEYKMVKLQIGTPGTYSEINLNVYFMPTREEFFKLLNNFGELRGLVDDKGSVYFWDANLAVHEVVKPYVTPKNTFDHVSFDINVSDREAPNMYTWTRSRDEHIEHSPYLKKLLRPKLKEYKMLQVDPGEFAKNDKKVKIYQNPSHVEFLNLLDGVVEMRGLVDNTSDYLYVWDASLAIHMQIGKELGIMIQDYTEYYFTVDQDAGYATTINGINFAGSRGRSRSGQDEGRFFDRAMGTDVLKKLDIKEYKMIKVDQYFPGPNGGHSNFLANVFKNPTRQEFLSLLKVDLRGLVDDKENLYIWDASLAIHHTVAQELSLHIPDSGGSGGVFYDTMMFAKTKDYLYSEWEFDPIEGNDGHVVLVASRSKRRKDYGFESGKHAIEHSSFVKKALGIYQDVVVNTLKEYKLIKMDTDDPYMSVIKRYNIYKNPTGAQTAQLLNKHKELRGLVTKNDNVYVWKAYDQTHFSAQQELSDAGIEGFHGFAHSFVLSTKDDIDDGDWQNLESYGKYFYQAYMYSGSTGDPVSSRLARILKYFQKLKKMGRNKNG